MAKKKTVPQARTRPTTPPAVPAQLAGLLALVEAQVESSHADEMGRAVATARQALADAMRDDVFDAVAVFIADEARLGPWCEAHAKLDAYPDPTDSPVGATAADLSNCYGFPGLILGMALMYVFLTEGGAR